MSHPPAPVGLIRCSVFVRLRPSLALDGGASQDFVLTPSDYTVRIPGSGGAPDQCECGLFAFDAGEGLLPLWILGDPFLRTYFAVFDRDRNVLQFAKAHA